MMSAIGSTGEGFVGRLAVEHRNRRSPSWLALLVSGVLAVTLFSGCGGGDDEADRPTTTVPYEEPVSDGASQ